MRLLSAAHILVSHLERLATGGALEFLKDHDYDKNVPSLKLETLAFVQLDKTK